MMICEIVFFQMRFHSQVLGCRHYLSGGLTIQPRKTIKAITHMDEWERDMDLELPGEFPSS